MVNRNDTPNGCLTVGPRLPEQTPQHVFGGSLTRPAWAGLRAMAHPLRLQILSLLTGSAMCAAEVAREIGCHPGQRQLPPAPAHEARLLVVAEEVSVRGGRAKRYRYDVGAPGATGPGPASAALSSAISEELVRRHAAGRRVGAAREPTPSCGSDPEAGRDLRPGHRGDDRTCTTLPGHRGRRGRCAPA